MHGKVWTVEEKLEIALDSAQFYFYVEVGLKIDNAVHSTLLC